MLQAPGAGASSTGIKKARIPSTYASGAEVKQIVGARPETAKLPDHRGPHRSKPGNAAA